VLADEHQLLFSWEWKRAKQECFDVAEDGSVEANANGEGEDCRV
jgi:hypothetical protein